MKKIDMLMLFLSLNISSYAFDNRNIDKIEFTITDKNLIDNSFITLLINNKTSSDYYLPIINTAEAVKWDLMLPFEERSFFFLIAVFFNDSTKEIPWVTQDCDNFGRSDELYQLWIQKKKKLEVKDLILIKSGDSITIRLPVKLSVKLSKDCTWKLHYDEKKVLNTSLIYSKKEIVLESKYLNRKTLKTLKRMGYKLYTDEIISNNVILTPNFENSSKDLEQKKNNIDSSDIKFEERIKKHVDIPKGSVQETYFRYFTQNLRHLHRDKTYPSFPTEKLCSIEKCFRSLSFPEINLIIYRRLIEIARINFKNKIYLYLVAGTGSVQFSEKQNENITDDNHLIYISVDDFICSKEILKGVEIYNAETRELMAKTKRQ